MAIGVAIPKYVSRSTGGNACCKSAYNARAKIIDNNTGEIFDFIKRGGNVFHEILLPDHVDTKFKNHSIFSNEVERTEKKKNSQLYVEWLVPLAKEDDNVDLEFRIETAKEFVRRKEWVKEGLGVQIDIHKPHDGEVNWHAHILVTTRRFTLDGAELGEKARDLQPINRKGIVQNSHELNDNILLRDIQNEQFKARGMSNRVDLPGELTQEHIGPVRMRSVLNQAVDRNEERRLTNIENLNSGKRLLEKVTHHMSVFNKNDLNRTVKFIPDIAKQERLVEEALASKSLVALFDASGQAIGYYTTEEVRREETKLLRLSGYVVNIDNVIVNTNTSIGISGNKSLRHIKELVEHARPNLSEEQHSALSHLLLGNGGMRILRGRAGTGKSHVLGKVASIAKAAGINVIGVAPTHKARTELAAVGYEQNDTVKGMLFGLANGRFDLPKYSLLVVDEAGMVGNDDYQELLRVAATRKCNVILAGDERQLSSVQRGGMFEVFAQSFGSTTLLNIQRQKESWAREVAMAFSKGEAQTGIAILQANNRIIESKDSNESMQVLLANWNKSEELIANKMIIAVKNKDVDALNHGARQYLKLEGKLSGEEFEVAGNRYMQGDRILIRETNKDLGLTNGDFATITELSKERFIVLLDQENGTKDKSNSTNLESKEIAFNPGEYNGFRHGYASTVFKVQGASINDVFVYHDGFAGIRNSYVALSRTIKDLKLYINKQSTRNINHLVKQLGHDAEIGSSLSYMTAKEIENQKVNDEFAKHKGIIGNMLVGALDYATRKITELTDKHIPKSEYYRYIAPKLEKEPVSKVIDEKLEEVARAGELERLVVGGNLFASSLNITSSNISYQQVTNPEVINIESHSIKSGTVNMTNPVNVSNSTKHVNSTSNNVSKIENIVNKKPKQSAKDRFYAQAEHARKLSVNMARQAQWQQESEQLRHQVSFKTEQIVRDLLGEPNNKLSNGRNLRYGEHGKLVVRISGERRGTWYDFSTGTGGDIFALVQDKQSCDFKGAADYLRNYLGIEKSTNSHIHLRLVDEHRNGDLAAKYHKEKIAEAKLAKAKEVQVAKLWQRAKALNEKSVAQRYLAHTRGITCNGGDDIKRAGIFDAGKGKYLPALIAFTRDSAGNITGGQQILLNKYKATKAGIDIPKKSFGIIAGSFVNLGHTIDRNMSKGNDIAADKIAQVTIIAEGIETGLSIKQALSNEAINIKVLCSLGISNIKNYQAITNEKIIIAADNDGQQAISNKTIENAKQALEAKGAFVEIVRPEQLGDFNDMLVAGMVTGKEGEQQIQAHFSSALAKHRAQTVTDYFASLHPSYSGAVNKTNAPIVETGTVAGTSNEINHTINNKTINDVTTSSFALGQYISKQEQADLAYIQKYQLSEQQIVDAYRRSNLQGQIELEQSRKNLEFAAKAYQQNNGTLAEAGNRGYKYDEINTVKFLIGKSETEAREHCTELRNQHLSAYLEKHVGEFRKQKLHTIDLDKIKGIISAEQKFLKETFESLKSPIDHYGNDIYSDLRSGEIAATQPQILKGVLNTIDKIHEENIESPYYLAMTLRGTNNAEHLLDMLEGTVERYYVYTKLGQVALERSNAKSLEEVFVGINAEQNILADLYGQIKHCAGDKDLLAKMALAHEHRHDNVLAELKSVTEQSIIIGVKTEESLLKELQQTTDLKTSYTSLDQAIELHQISSKIVTLNQKRQQATTPEEALAAIGQKVEYLANLHGNLKYPEQNMELTNACALAKSQHEEGLPAKLNELAKHSLATGAKTEASLLQKLQEIHQVKDTMLIYTKLDQDIEIHQINTTMAKLSQGKAEAKTPEAAIGCLAKEQEFLAGLHGNLKYPHQHDNTLLSIIKIAHANQQENAMENLIKMTNFFEKVGFAKNASVLTTLKNTTNPIDAHKSLLQDFHAHVLGSINKGLEILEDGKVLVFDKHKFDCPIKFIDYITDTRTHEFMPHKEIQQIKIKVIEHQKQLALEKEMDGFSL